MRVMNQPCTLTRVLEGAWEFDKPVHMCFVELEKVFDRVHEDVLWWVLSEYGSTKRRGSLVTSHSLFLTSPMVMNCR